MDMEITLRLADVLEVMGDLARAETERDELRREVCRLGRELEEAKEQVAIEAASAELWESAATEVVSQRDQARRERDEALGILQGECHRADRLVGAAKEATRERDEEFARGREVNRYAESVWAIVGNHARYIDELRRELAARDQALAEAVAEVAHLRGPAPSGPLQADGRRADVRGFGDPSPSPCVPVCPMGWCQVDPATGKFRGRQP